eukprot:scaffold19.g1750.t1
MTAPDIFPCPVFEGSEKRISVHFAAAAGAPPPPPGGLRTLARAQLDYMLDLAACQIVSSRSNEVFDAYVLSESSLFVYADRMVLKTCGTTKLLDCVPHMVELAAGVGMAPARVHYSRASFLFPDQQPAPHRSFASECAALRGVFGGLGSDSAYVLGDALNGLQWHVFVAGEGRGALGARLGESRSGCAGRAGAHSTIHITPEEGFSYASFEICGYGPEAWDTADLVARCAAIFEPLSMSVALSLDSVAPGATAPGWGGAFVGPPGYDCHSASYQETKCGGYVAFFTLESAAAALPSPRGAKAGAGAAAPASSDGGSPRGVLKHFPSCSNLAGAAAAAAAAALAAAGGGTPASEASSEGLAPATAAGSEGGGSACEDLAASMMSVMTELDLLALERGAGGAPGSARGDADADAASDDARSLGADAQLMALDPAELRFEDVLALHGAAHLPSGSAECVEAHMRGLVGEHALEDNFYVVDLGALRRLHAAWAAAMPRVAPFYAVKCNPDPGILAALASLGACFDCASEAELAAVLGLGVPPDRVVFANPCKRPRDIRYAAAKGVALSSFDTEAELAKLARWQPGARVLLRIRADDPTARCQARLGNKYGAEPHEWPGLLAAAAAAGVPVAGVAFHVGSGATDPAAFAYAIQLARAAFDLGAAHGFDMQARPGRLGRCSGGLVLDIGGGFCGGRFGPDGTVDMGGVPAAVNAALALHFPESTGVRVIAEPGRFFAESVATLGCLVFGRRPRAAAAAGAAGGAAAPAAQAPGFDYWVTDGIYGSMNSMLYDHATLAVRPLACAAAGGGAPPAAAPHHLSTVFGPSCDGLDTLLRDVTLPELQVGDWLAFPAMGAYTICGASKFNGINAVDVPTFYVYSAAP